MAQLIETKVFAGSQLNSDTAVEYMDQTDLISGVGFRVHTTKGNKQGLVVTLEGNRELTRSLPSGTNKLIRAEVFEKVGKAYLFVRNGSGRHRIEEFDVNNHTFVTLFEDRTGSGGNQLLPWLSTEYIKDVKLVMGEVLYWTEFPNDQVRRLDVTKAKSGGYGVVTSLDLGVSVPAPTSRPFLYYMTDDRQQFNNIRGKLFQVRFRYTFERNEKSVWSIISERAIPTGESNRPTSITDNNALRLFIPLDDSLSYTGIEISVRDGYSDWHTVKDVSRSYINSLPFEELPPLPEPGEVPLPYYPPVESRYLAISPDFGGYSLVFYNDGLYPTDPVVDHQQLYDAAPIKSRALEVVNGNVIALGNNVVGYPNPSGVSLNLSVSYKPWPTLSSSTDGMSVVRFGTASDGLVEVIFTGSPVAGDVASLNFESTIPAPNVVAYTVNESTEGFLLAAVSALMEELPTEYIYGRSVLPLDNGDVQLRFRSQLKGTPPMTLAWMRLVSASVSNPGVFPRNLSYPTLKLGSSYKAAVAFFDNKGTPFNIVESGAVKTNMYPETATSPQNGASPVLRWELTGQPPVGAAYYSVLLSENRTHLDTAYTFVLQDAKTTSEWLWLDVSMLYVDSIEGTKSGWTFDVGDKLVFIGNPYQPLYQKEPAYVADVAEYELVVNNNQVKHLIRVANPTADPTFNTVLNSTANPAFVEIYKPKASQTDTVYYEVSDMYRILSGTYTISSDEILAMDTYIRYKRMPYNFSGVGTFKDVWVEDFSFSDNYVSNFTQGGRPRAPKDVPDDDVFPAEIRYSREWIVGSEYNSINRFYPEDVYDSRKPMYGPKQYYGGIQYLTIREGRLIVVQETKLGFVPVNRSIIEDLAEQQQIGISSILFNPIEYYAGSDIGIGNSYAVPSYHYEHGTAYFIDPHNLALVRAGIDGTRDISGKYSGAVSEAVRTSLSSGKYIYSIYDSRYDELILSINDTAYTYSSGIGGFVPNKPYAPEGGFTVKDRLYTASSGKLYIHDDEINRGRFYGVSYPATLEFSITSPGIKHFQSIEIHSDTVVTTTPGGIKTQLGQESELNLVSDFTDRGLGVYTANLLRATNSPGGTIVGDRLSGRWIGFELTVPAGGSQPQPEVNLLKLTLKSTAAQGNLY